jgi:uncharacterized protein (DUF2141 family)
MRVTVRKAIELSDYASRLSLFLTLVVGMAAPSNAFADAAVSNSVIGDDGKCIAVEGAAVVAVSVDNIQDVQGNLRAQIYGENPDDFLEKGKKLVRVDVPVVTTDTSLICVPLPAPGTYALVVMHDKNANGKADFFTEGFGFSNNPKLSFGPPDAEEVMFSALPGVSEQDVTLNYVFSSDDDKKDKRRRLRRR